MNKIAVICHNPIGRGKLILIHLNLGRTILIAKIATTIVMIKSLIGISHPKSAISVFPCKKTHKYSDLLNRIKMPLQY